VTEEKDGLNQYTCNTCNGTITTINRVEGVTPAFLACRATNGCMGRMSSHFYRVTGSPEPTHEWFRPSLKNARRHGPEMFDHVKGGGLEIRALP